MIGNKQNSNLCSFAENPTGRIISGHTVGSSENFESHWHWDVHLGECGMSQGATLIISFIFLKRLAPGIVWKPFGCWQVTMAFHREGWGFFIIGLKSTTQGGASFDRIEKSLNAFKLSKQKPASWNNSKTLKILYFTRVEGGGDGRGP